MKTLSLKCPDCRSDRFELRILRDEAVASAHCVSCSKDYLLLDSKDYWFDVIQQGYPRITRCTCKSESFRLRIDYANRDDGNINYIELHSICTACEKAKRQLNMDIDYSGTKHLIEKPLVACKNPKILYDLKDLSLLLLLPDMLRIFDHLADQGCTFYSVVSRDKAWVLVQQKIAQVKATLENGGYLYIYAIPKHLEIPDPQNSTSKEEDAFWKCSEVIRIGSKYHVCRDPQNTDSISYCSAPQIFPSYTEVGLSIHIHFSNEFVLREKIVQKSEAFRALTASLLAMLQQYFVSWRSPYCFDNPEVNVRIFGDRFKKKMKAKK